MGKNVAVFVDVANIFYAAKAAGVDIDYVTLLKSATAGRDFVRAYAYTGLDPDNENQRNFHSFLARNHYKVVSKDIRKYGDGKVKANLDIELVVDLMKTARNLDIAIVVSGDGDFAPAIRAVQEMGVRVEVISFRGNTSSDLIDVADLFTDITQLARVDKSSSRSGRRVAGDEEDLSMTEVPDKQTEGTGSRSRGRGRGRGRPSDGEPAVAATRSPRGGRPDAAVAASANGGGPLTVLPGEKLSRVGPATSGDDEVLDDDELETIDEGEFAAALQGEGEDEAGRRRRRRRGGRGRGRGRGRGEEGFVGEAAERLSEDAGPDEEDREELPAPAPSRPRTTPFGSFWDSQLGVQPPARRPVEPLGDDEDFEEPEIPEYLIAEQRRGQQQRQQARGPRGGGGGGRGNRSAYTAAIERERYGRGGGGGGINRYPDVSGRERQGGGGQRGGNRDVGYPRPERQERPERPPRQSGGDPWSEVPPELEEMLRAQLAQTSKGRPAPTGAPRPTTRSDEPAETAGTAPSESAAAEPDAPKRRTTRRTTKSTSDTPAATSGTAGAAATVDAEPAATAKRRTTRKPAAASSADASATAAGSPSTPVASAPEGLAAAAPKRRTTRKPAAAATSGAADAGTGSGEGSPGSADETTAPPATPKRRTTRKTAPAD